MAKEYIEREALLEWAKEFYPEEKVFASAVINAPTADVQEVRHGKWIKFKHSKFRNEFKCLFCNYSYFTDTTEYNFCPNCGAKMDKE